MVVIAEFAPLSFLISTLNLPSEASVRVNRQNLPLLKMVLRPFSKLSKNSVFQTSWAWVEIGAEDSACIWTGAGRNATFTDVGAGGGAATEATTVGIVPPPHDPDPK